MHSDSLMLSPIVDSSMDGVGIEKFAEYCHIVADNYVDELTDGRCKCCQVELFEHENNSAIYSSTE